MGRAEKLTTFVWRLFKSGSQNLLEPLGPVLYLCNLEGFQSGEADVRLGYDNDSIPEEVDPVNPLAPEFSFKF